MASAEHPDQKQHQPPASKRPVSEEHIDRHHAGGEIEKAARDVMSSPANQAIENVAAVELADWDQVQGRDENPDPAGEEHGIHSQVARSTECVDQPAQQKGIFKNKDASAAR